MTGNDVGTMTWNELAEFVPQGLKLGSPRIIEHPDGTLKELIFPIEEMSETVSKKLAKKRAKPGMAKTLKALWDRAAENMGQTQRIDNLGGGLGVDLLISGDGSVRYQIYRANVAPSDGEWETMLRYLPSPMIADGLRRFEYKGRHYIQASLLLAEEKR